MIDLSQINEITVDPAASTVRIGGGALLKDLIDATHEHGLTVPVGIIGTTGVGGLTLGGGVGHLSRAFGLTIDNLVGATVVLADGSVVQTDAEHEPDLFWAIRGGGGNFGVVTEFTFRCNPLTTVLAGPVLYDLDDMPDVMRWYDGFIASAPDELGGWFAYLSVPPGPPFPEELHLRKVCAVVWTQPGEEESTALREGRAYGKPLLDGVAPMPFPAWNTAFDGLLPPGEQWYWRGEFFDEMSDGLIEANVEWAPKAPTWKCTMHMYAIDGAGSRPGNDETAWAYRGARWAQVIGGIDPDPANAGAISDWARGYSDATRPYAMSGGYLNFQMDEAGSRAGDVRGELRPARADQGALRPGQRVLGQPEHRARGLAGISNRAAGDVPPPAPARRSACRRAGTTRRTRPSRSLARSPRPGEGRKGLCCPWSPAPRHGTRL